MSCPSSTTLTEFEHGRLPDRRSLEVSGHVDTCATCQATLARTGREQLMKIMGQQRAKTPLPVPQTPLTPLYEEAPPLFEVKPGDLVAERYRVERVIGDGGMGFVVAARHVALDQLVAMKLLRPELLLEPGAVPRFVREARAASRLKSRHVARVFDLGTTSAGVPYLVMELLEGTDLGGHLANHGPMPEVEAAHYISQACEALAEAHAAEIIHRDLKPENMFLARDRDGGINLKILDFGVSKVGGARPPSEMVSTASKSLFGSPLYMSPEHLLSAKKVDARSDVWALGVILYYLVSMRFPFDGDSIAGLAASVLRDPPAPLIAPVSDQFHAIVMRCLSRSPDDRYPTAAELGAALAELPWQTSRGGGPMVTVVDHTSGAVDAPMASVDSSGLARTRPMGSGPPFPEPPPRAKSVPPTAAKKPTSQPPIAGRELTPPKGAGPVAPRPPQVEFAAGRTALASTATTLPPPFTEPARKKWLVPAVSAIAITLGGIVLVATGGKKPAPAVAPTVDAARGAVSAPPPAIPDAAPTAPPADAARAAITPPIPTTTPDAARAKTPSKTPAKPPIKPPVTNTKRPPDAAAGDGELLDPQL